MFGVRVNSGTELSLNINYPFTERTSESTSVVLGEGLLLPGAGPRPSSTTHHPEPEEAERSRALESGDPHGRLPFWASGGCDVDLRQDHSTETQPGPPTLTLTH